MRFAGLILFLCVAMVGCAARPLPDVSAPTEIDVISNATLLRQWSEAEQDALEKSGLLYKDTMLEEYLTQIARTLEPRDALDHVAFCVKIIKNPYMNAFAYPNGVIYLYTGILAQLDNEAQLAALLAHEIVHCIQGHALKSFLAARTPTSESHLENDLETEADMTGLGMVIAAGYDPGEAPKLFRSLESELALEEINGPAHLRPHAALQKRLAKHQHLLAELAPDKTGGIKNAAGFLDRIQLLIIDNARLNLSHGRFAAAQQGLEKYLNLNPADARAHFLLGEVLRQNGHPDAPVRAKIHYETAIELDPLFAEPYKAIGLIYFKAGEMTLARQSFESCLSLSPQMPDKAHIQGYLKQCH